VEKNQSARLPHLGKGHVRVDILKPRFMRPLHVGKLGKEELLLGIILETGQLGIHLHCLKLFFNCNYQTIEWF